MNSCISRKFSFFTISIDKVIIIFCFIHYFIEKHIYIYRQDQFSFTIFLFESFGNCFSVSVTFVELYDQNIWLCNFHINQVQLQSNKIMFSFLRFIYLKYSLQESFFESSFLKYLSSRPIWYLTLQLQKRFFTWHEIC